MRRYVNPKAFSEPFHVVHVLLSRGIAMSVAEHLNLGRQTTNAEPLNLASPLIHEAIRRARNAWTARIVENAPVTPRT